MLSNLWSKPTMHYSNSISIYAIYELCVVNSILEGEICGWESKAYGYYKDTLNEFHIFTTHTK